MRRSRCRSRLAVLAVLLGVTLQIPACQPETVQAFAADLLRAALATWLL